MFNFLNVIKLRKNTNKVFEAARAQRETITPVGVDLGPQNSLKSPKRR